MKRSFRYANYVGMCFVGVLLNCALSTLNGYLELPLYLDSIGTVLCAMTVGYIAELVDKGLTVVLALLIIYLIGRINPGFQKNMVCDMADTSDSVRDFRGTRGHNPLQKCHNR